MDDDKQIEALFAAARQDRSELPDTLSQRMLRDAEQTQQGFARPEAVVTAGPGLLGQIKAALGGWPTLGGLATACLAGLWIGVAPPAFLPDPLDLVYSDDALSVLDQDSALSEFLTEDG